MSRRKNKKADSEAALNKPEEKKDNTDTMAETNEEAAVEEIKKEEIDTKADKKAEKKREKRASRRRPGRAERNRIAAIIAVTVPLLLIIVGAVWFVMGYNYKLSRLETTVPGQVALSGSSVNGYTEDKGGAGYRDIEKLDDFGEEKWNEGVIRYKGRSYKYNENLQNYLFMGIDNDDIARQAADGISGGQADALFLLVIDENRRDVKIVSINRNSMVPVDVYDREGNFLVQMDLQICLQHGYGDGLKLSCMRSVEAVNRLFRDVPVSGYMSLNMGGLAAVNDAIGGVEITPIQSVVRGDVVITKDVPVNLNGEQAYAYIRTRDVDKFASANDRLARQQQYILAFVQKVLAEPTLGNKLYEAGKDYIVASIDIPKLINSAKGMTFDENSMYTLEGETVVKDDFEQFNIDEEAMIKLILDVFYEEVQ